MKKGISALLALFFAISVTGTCFAANLFSDVPKDHWSYQAISKLSKDGIVEGYANGTFQGDHVLSRYEMAIIVARAMTKMEKANASDKALIEKLSAEYATELDKLNAKVDKLDKRVDNVMLNGFVRAKYDSDTSDGRSTNVNKHFYMNFEGKMKVNEGWDAHFQSETRKGYTANGQYWRKPGEDDQDGTFQRIWVEGKSGEIGVTLGKKWWGYGFQNVAFGHAANGAQLDYAFSPSWKGSVFSLRPTQGNLMSMGNGSEDDLDSQTANIRGVNFVGKIAPNLEANVVYAANDDKNIQKMDRWGSVDLRSKLNNSLTLTATYSKTNADCEDNSQEYRLDYKRIDLNKVGSFGAYIRYIKFAKYGDASHDDEWGSLPTDAKGWIFGILYVPYKNVQWETFYSDQKLNISGMSQNTYNYGSGPVEQNADRKLIRTQLDFHF